MPTFLRLTQDLRRECSVAGDGPLTVTGQTTEYFRLIEWIQSSHEEIQTKWFDWGFLWGEAGFSTILDQGSYNLSDSASMGGSGNVISDFAKMAKYNPGSGRTGEKLWIDGSTQLPYIPWSDYDLSAYSSSGKPTAFTIKPDGAIAMLPTPDGVYAITFEYYKTPTVLVNDADISPIPERFHRAIVARAMIYYGNYENAPEIKADGMERYKEAMDQLEADQLPSSTEYRYSTNNDFQISVNDYN